MPTYPGAISFAQFTGPAHPLIQGFQVGGVQAPTGIHRCPKTWGISELTLTSAGRSSTSQDNRNHAPIAAGPTQFHFAPTVDDVVISWKLRDGARAQTLILELFRVGWGAPIWRRTLNAAAAQAGTLDWSGVFPAGEWIDQVRFPHHMVTAADSPYQFKARAEGGDIEDGYVERFTYFNVLVDSLELEWGGSPLLPAGAAAGVTVPFQADTRAAEVTLLADLAAGGNPSQANMEVILPCNQFGSAAAQMQGDFLFTKHREQWGTGPRIPLKVKVLLARAAGGGVHGGESAKALGALELLWDWESDDETALLPARYAKAPVRAFLDPRLRHKRNDGTAPTDSTNCHVDHGGKRGGGAIFPAIAPPDFPFTVAAAPTRVWAATSTLLTTGAHAGYSGVLFQPSRMARDTFKVSVSVARIAGNPVLDTLAAAPALRGQYPDLPTVSTGTFEVLRRINARYIRKDATVAASNVALASTEHALSGVRLVWAANEDAAFQAQWDTHFDRIRNRTLKDRHGVVSPNAGSPVPDWHDELQLAFEGIPQGFATTHAAVTAWEYPVFKEKHLVEVTREYVHENRFFNTPLRRYTAWRHAAGAAANDAVYLLGFYNGLSARKRAIIDARVDARLAGLTVANNAAYRNRLGLFGVHSFKRIAQQYLIETATAANAGFVTFHVVDTFRLRRPDGTHETVPSDSGGLAPSFETLPSGKHALLLIYLPDVVRAGLVNHYTVGAQPVIAHEAGHTFFLCHAPASPGIADAPGFSATHHDPADLFCLMNYDFTSDHLCGLCNLKLRGWSLAGMGLAV